MARPQRAAAAEGEAPATSKYRRKVRAKEEGYYAHGLRRPGDVFIITDPKHFSQRWMEDADPDEPTRVTRAQQALNQRSEEIADGKRQKPTGSADAIGADE